MRGGQYVSSERLYEEWSLGRIDTQTLLQVLLGAPISIVQDAATFSWLTRQNALPMDEQADLRESILNVRLLQSI